MSNFFNNLVDELKDEDTKILSEGGASAEYTGCIDTGSYALNAVLSGSIYGGVPNNKVTAFAGESATGKTFFVLGIVKQFLDSNPTGGVIYFDTEARCHERYDGRPRYRHVTSCDLRTRYHSKVSPHLTEDH